MGKRHKRRNNNTLNYYVVCDRPVKNDAGEMSMSEDS